MSDMKNDEFSLPSLETFSTCPQISVVPKESYLHNVIDVAKWSEEHGCRGILVYTDNSQADPWVIAQIIKQFVASPDAVSFSGEFYTVNNLRLTPPLPPELFPVSFISGSSEAGLSAAQAIGATAIKYPKPANECAQEPPDAGLDSGIRVGVIARADEGEAWRVALQRFPEDRKGQLTHQLAMKVSDSSWHHQLSEMAKETKSDHNPYWLVPFENYKTFCPYLVGSYDRGAEDIL